MCFTGTAEVRNSVVSFVAMRLIRGAATCSNTVDSEAILSWLRLLPWAKATQATGKAYLNGEVYLRHLHEGFNTNMAEHFSVNFEALLFLSSIQILERKHSPYRWLKVRQADCGKYHIQLWKGRGGY